jgi:hypothetical protein
MFFPPSDVIMSGFAPGLGPDLGGIVGIRTAEMQKFPQFVGIGIRHLVEL